MANPQYIFVHHTGGSDANPLQDSSGFTFQQCDELHKQRFDLISSLGSYVGYQYYIEKDGSVHQARKDDEEGAHTIGYNFNSIGICLAGNFDATLPTNAQIDALRTLLQQKTAQWGIPLTNIHPHRWAANKTCYGTKLSDTWASELLNSQNTQTEEISRLMQIIHILRQWLMDHGITPVQ